MNFDNLNAGQALQQASQAQVAFEKTHSTEAPVALWWHGFVTHTLHAHSFLGFLLHVHHLIPWWVPMGIALCFWPFGVNLRLAMRRRDYWSNMSAYQQDKRLQKITRDWRSTAGLVAFWLYLNWAVGLTSNTGAVLVACMDAVVILMALVGATVLVLLKGLRVMSDATTPSYLKQVERESIQKLRWVTDALDAEAEYQEERAMADTMRREIEVVAQARRSQLRVVQGGR